LLFVGVSVSSGISIDNKPSISQDESEDDCRCNEISDADIVKLEKQLDRLEVYSKLLLVLPSNNPKTFLKLPNNSSKHVSIIETTVTIINHYLI